VYGEPLCAGGGRVTGEDLMDGRDLSYLNSDY
jgi:hypothetical protein